MVKQKESKPSKRRTQVTDLPKKEEKLSPDEMKKVKGGDWLMTPAGTAKPKPGGN